jgi:hypothetical protein
MTSRRRDLTLVALFATAAGPAAGQVRASLDVGAGSYRPDGALASAVASLAPALQLDAGPVRFDAAGVYSDAPAGRWNFQGASRLLLRSPYLAFFRAELAGTADWTSHRRVDGTAVLGAEARIYAHPIAGSSIWAGHSRGLAWSLGEQTPIRRTQAGASASRGRLQVGVTLASTSFDAPGTDGRVAGLAPLVDGLIATDSAAPPTGPRRGDRAGFTDAMLWGRWSYAAFDLDLSVGRRFSRSSPEVTLWSVSAARSVVPGLALVAAAGRAGSDPVTALPGSRYVVLGFRIAAGAARMRAREDDTRAPVRAGFRVGPATNDGREIVVRAPEALAVELAGDFTNWEPVALQSADNDEWRIVLPIAPGLHRAIVRADGGAWRVPPGTRAVESEFGPQVGEFIVE